MLSDEDGRSGGSARRSGRRGRRFKYSHLDQLFTEFVGSMALSTDVVA